MISCFFFLIVFLGLTAGQCPSGCEDWTSMMPIFYPRMLIENSTTYSPTDGDSCKQLGHKVAVHGNFLYYNYFEPYDLAYTYKVDFTAPANGSDPERKRSPVRVPVLDGHVLAGSATVFSPPFVYFTQAPNLRGFYSASPLTKQTLHRFDLRTETLTQLSWGSGGPMEWPTILLMEDIDKSGWLYTFEQVKEPRVTSQYKFWRLNPTTNVMQDLGCQLDGWEPKSPFYVKSSLNRLWITVTKYYSGASRDFAVCDFSSLPGTLTLMSRPVLWNPASFFVYPASGQQYLYFIDTNYASSTSWNSPQGFERMPILSTNHADIEKVASGAAPTFLTPFVNGREPLNTSPDGVMSDTSVKNGKLRPATISLVNNADGYTVANGPHAGKIVVRYRFTFNHDRSPLYDVPGLYDPATHSIRLFMEHTGMGSPCRWQIQDNRLNELNWYDFHWSSDGNQLFWSGSQAFVTNKWYSVCPTYDRAWNDFGCPGAFWMWDFNAQPNGLNFFEQPLPDYCCARGLSGDYSGCVALENNVTTPGYISNCFQRQCTCGGPVPDNLGQCSLKRTNARCCNDDEAPGYCGSPAHLAAEEESSPGSTHPCQIWDCIGSTSKYCRLAYTFRQDLDDHDCCYSAGNCPASTQCRQYTGCDQPLRVCTFDVPSLPGVCCSNSTDCSDGLPCTVGICNQSNSTCTQTLLTDPAAIQQACDDTEPCTVDSCPAAANGTCVNQWIAGCGIGLSVSDGHQLEPSFDESIGQYTVTLPADADSVTVTATARSEGATIAGDGTKAAPAVGECTDDLFQIVVTEPAADGAVTMFDLKVCRQDEVAVTTTVVAASSSADETVVAGSEADTPSPPSTTADGDGGGGDQIDNDNSDMTIQGGLSDTFGALWWWPFLAAGVCCCLTLFLVLLMFVRRRRRRRAHHHQAPTTTTAMGSIYAADTGASSGRSRTHSRSRSRSGSSAGRSRSGSRGSRRSRSGSRSSRVLGNGTTAEMGRAINVE